MQHLMTCSFTPISYLIWVAVDLSFCGMQQVQATQNIHTLFHILFPLF